MSSELANVPPYNPELGLQVCAFRREGKSLLAICGLLDIPSPWVIAQWARHNREFADMYYRAGVDEADSLTVQIIGVADNADDDAKARRRILARKIRIEFLMKQFAANVAPRPEQPVPIPVIINMDHKPQP